MKVLEKTPRPSLRVKRGRPNKKTKNLFVLKFSKNTALTMSPPLPLSLLPSLWLCKGYVSRGARCVAFLLVLRSYVKERRLGEELCGVWVRWWLFLGCLRPIKHPFNAKNILMQHKLLSAKATVAQWLASLRRVWGEPQLRKYENPILRFHSSGPTSVCASLLSKYYALALHSKKEICPRENAGVTLNAKRKPPFEILLQKHYNRIPRKQKISPQQF